MSDKAFWENYINGDMDIDKLKEAVDYKGIRKEFLDNLPESARQAWERAAEAAGTDALGVDENAALKGGSTKVCGDTADSVLEFAKTALLHLEDSYQPRYSTNLQELKEKEILFYQNLFMYLS